MDAIKMRGWSEPTVLFWENVERVLNTDYEPSSLESAILAFAYSLAADKIRECSDSVTKALSSCGLHGCILPRNHDGAHRC